METPNEKLSLLLDEALDANAARRLLGSLRNDAALQASWRDYHLIRQSLRREPVALADGDFAARMSQRLAAEPAYFPQRQRRREREWLRPIGGLALAAAVSAVAVFGAREYGIAHMPDSAMGWMASGEYETRGVQQAGYGLSPEKLSEYLAMHHDGLYSAGAAELLPQVDIDHP